MRIAAWLFIAEGAYIVFRALYDFAGSNDPMATIHLGRSMMSSGFSIVSGILILNQMFWGRALGIIYGGYGVLSGISAFLMGSNSPLWTMSITVLYLFQCGVLIFAGDYFDPWLRIHR